MASVPKGGALGGEPLRRAASGWDHARLDQEIRRPLRHVPIGCRDRLDEGWIRGLLLPQAIPSRLPDARGESPLGPPYPEAPWPDAMVFPETQAPTRNDRA